MCNMKKTLLSMFRRNETYKTFREASKHQNSLVLVNDEKEKVLRCHSKRLRLSSEESNPAESTVTEPETYEAATGGQETYSYDRLQTEISTENCLQYPTRVGKITAFEKLKNVVSLKNRRFAICEEMEKIINENGVTLREYRKLLVTNNLLYEMKLL